METQPLLPVAVHVEEFRETKEALACRSPQGAYANCYAASVHFARFLRLRNVECGLLHVSGSKAVMSLGAGRWPWVDQRRLEHWVVLVYPNKAPQGTSLFR